VQGTKQRTTARALAGPPGRVVCRFARSDLGYSGSELPSLFADWSRFAGQSSSSFLILVLGTSSRGLAHKTERRNEMSESTCANCGEPIVEGRLNCSKCGAVYPDAGERELTWDPSDQEDDKS
jgi:hypothetical protein